MPAAGPRMHTCALSTSMHPDFRVGWKSGPSKWWEKFCNPRKPSETKAPALKRRRSRATWCRVPFTIHHLPSTEHPKQPKHRVPSRTNPTYNPPHATQQQAVAIEATMLYGICCMLSCSCAVKVNPV